MGAPANYDDVIDQLLSIGLQVTTIETGRMVRCRVEGDREKRGWYMVHDLPLPSGELLLVGTFGVWRGNDPGTIKIDLKKRDTALSDEQRDALRRRLAEDRKRTKLAAEQAAQRAAARATAAWGRLSETGESDYLAAKGVGAFGVRYTPNGSVALPMLDATGRTHGLQFLRSGKQAETSKRPAKEFWPPGAVKKSHFHLIGAPQWLVLVAEGYATGASLHMATGYPVAIAFDAGNLVHVAGALRKRYRSARILICADDDALQKCRACQIRLLLAEHPETCPSCGEPHHAENAGISGASAAALESNGAWVIPRFSEANESARRTQFLEHGRKLTDFNDLHVREGLQSVRVQIEARLSELKWHAELPRVNNITSGDGGNELRPIDSINALLERYVLIYAQGSMVFDRQEHMLLSISDMRDICIRRDLHRSWSESPARAIARIENVDFDPSCSKPEVTCNLWAGWPTKPKPGKCEKLLELLWHMCGEETNARELYKWVLSWMAYPLQHPGAKMKTTIVIHGPQGTGKNMLFEAYMSIYGKYGRMLDQGALEDKFNDWASRKLFLIADEVVARTEIYHLKNKLKTLITGERIRINPKNMAAYEEDNHANIVFLSNEAMPVVLEEDDRRHAVIWTPDKLPEDFYVELIAEIANGGAAALHDHLLNLDLSGFTNGTLPPMTTAKSDLIGLGLDSPQRFADGILSGEIPGLTARPALSTDWYEAYRLWCAKDGVRAAPRARFIHALARKRKIACERKRYMIEQTTHGPHGMLMLGIGYDPGASQTETSFLGDQVVALRSEINEYRGRA